MAPSSEISTTHSGDASVGLRTLAKGLRLLESLAESGPKGMALTTLSNRVGMHRVTTHRFLLTLQALGYVEQDEATDRFRVGAKILDLASSFLSRIDLRGVAHPLLEELNRATGETVHTVILDRHEVVTVDRIEAEHPIVLRTEVGARRPLHSTATGKSMLAFLPEDDIIQVLASGLSRFTSNTLTDPRSLREALQEVRRRGYALDNQEHLEGMRCAAAPIFDHTGRVIGAISVAAPIQRLSLDQMEEWGELVRGAGARVSHRLGFRPGPPGPAFNP